MMLLVFALMSAVGVAAGPTTAVTASTPHLTLQGSVEPEVAAPNADLTIAFTIAPARGIHVYAPGAEYQVIAIALDAQPGVKARPVVYPPSEIYYFEPLDEEVPVYQKPFTLTQVVGVGAAAVKNRETLTLSGRIAYQACDDRVCFKPNAIPFRFELKVKR